jgi:hypothetical protein
MIDRLAAPLLLVGCVLLATILLFEITTPNHVPVVAGATAEQPDPPSAVRQLPTATAAPPVAAILARPLFSPTRRPAPPSVGSATDDGGLAQSRLAGIVIERGHRFAIFAPQGAKLLTVAEGETVSGWRVESISSREVSLSGPDGTKTLQPKFDPNLAPPAEPAAPAPPPPVPAGPVFGAPPNIRAAPGIAVPRPGAPVFIPGQARLRQLRRQ